MLNKMNRNDIAVAVSITIATLLMVIATASVYVASGWNI